MNGKRNHDCGLGTNKGVHIYLGQCQRLRWGGGKDKGISGNGMNMSLYGLAVYAHIASPVYQHYNLSLVLAKTPHPKLAIYMHFRGIIRGSLSLAYIRLSLVLSKKDVNVVYATQSSPGG